MVVGDQALLERLVANLLDNAIVHNDADERAGSGSRTGENRRARPGYGSPTAARSSTPREVEELFEPFRRGTGERVGGRDGGLGLGLSIVRAVAVAHAAKIESSRSACGRSRVRAALRLRCSCQTPDGGLETVTA